MHKKGVRIFLFAWMAVVILFFIAENPVYASDNTDRLSAPQNVRAVRRSNTAISLRWKAGTDVDGYILYRYHPSSRKYKTIKVIKDSSVNKWVDKRLKTNTVYKYKIASYRIEKGKKQVGTLSDWVSAKTYTRNSKYINAKAPRLDSRKVYLGLCSEQKVKGKVMASDYGTNKKKKPISTKIRWYSSNPSVAVVDQSGVITAGTKPGKCSVYAVSHNGAKKTIKVSVKNYAQDVDFYNYGREDDIYTLITDYKPQIQNIAEYYSIHRLTTKDPIYIDLDEHANVVITPNGADIGNLKEDIEKLLVDFPYYIRIVVTRNSVEYVLKKQDSEEALPGHVRYWFDDDCSQWSGQIADHWEANRYYPH